MRLASILGSDLETFVMMPRTIECREERSSCASEENGKAPSTTRTQHKRVASIPRVLSSLLFLLLISVEPVGYNVYLY